MRRYIKSDGTVTYHKSGGMVCTTDLSVMTLPEKLFLLDFYVETNSVIASEWGHQLLPHLSKHRILKLIEHYRADPFEYYFMKNDVMTRMF